MEIIQSKSLLAKLMATENLTVEERNVQTASFDVKNRVLTIPKLDKDISGYLYDLFVGHEVGHALYTPLEGINKAVDLKLDLSVMNVLEDSRIERKIKNKYPGIRISFVKGYRELIEKDFFGTKGVDFNELNFIDRVNMFTKGGATQGIKFTEEERKLVDEIESTETYDDVIAIAQKVGKYMEEEKEAKAKMKLQFADEDSQDEIDSDDLNNSDDFDNELDESFSSQSQNDIDESMDEIESQLQNETLTAQAGDSGQSESLTDKTFRENQNKLFENSNTHYYYGNIPKINLDEMIVSHKELWNRYRQEILNNNSYNDTEDYMEYYIDSKGFNKLRLDAKKVVGYLAKEFELRKNADQMKRATVSKTGELNMNKIYSYKFNEDIFKKMTVIPGGKSHGLVMFLDWSGSMTHHLENTVKQLINLVMFCKKVNIPYEVYAFTSEYDKPYNDEFKDGNIALRNIKLLNLFSSKMSAAEFSFAGAALTKCSRHRSWRPYWMQLGGTPLNEAIISAMEIIPKFQKDYKLQIVNTVFLTDGDGHNTCSVYYTDIEGRKCSGEKDKTLMNEMAENNLGNWNINKKFVIVDTVTKHKEICEKNYSHYLTSSYINILKKKTNCNVIGFYILSGREFGRAAHQFFPTISDITNLRTQFRKNKYQVVTTAGFDEYYLLRSEGLDTDEDVEFEVKENATTRGLVSAFSKYAGNRLSNRVVLNRFIGLIS